MSKEEHETTNKAADLEALMIEAAVLLPDGGVGIHESQELPLQPPERLDESLSPETAPRLFRDAHRRLSGS